MTTDQQNHAAFERILSLLDNPTPELQRALIEYTATPVETYERFLREPDAKTVTRGEYDALFDKAIRSLGR